PSTMCKHYESTSPRVSSRRAMLRPRALPRALDTKIRRPFADCSSATSGFLRRSTAGSFERPESWTFTYWGNDVFGLMVAPKLEIGPRNQSPYFTPQPY